MAAQTSAYTPEWIAAEEALGSRFIFSGSVPEMRQQFAGLMAMSAPSFPPMGDDVKKTDHQVNSRLKIRVYSPNNKKDNGPVGLKFFGGGWVMGGIDDAEDVSSYVFAQQTGTVIVGVNYSLAPEHKYPAAHDDAKSALKWVIDNASSLGVSPDKVYTVGTSAGGHMAISLALSQVNSQHPIKGIAALCPVTMHPDAIPSDLKDQFSTADNQDAAIINDGSMQTFMDSYQPDAKDPEFSFLLSKDIGKLPPLYIVVCSKDPLRDDGLVFEKAAKKAGVKTKMNYYEGLPHVFWALPGFPPGEAALGDIIGGLSWVISQI